MKAKSSAVAALLFLMCGSVLVRQAYPAQRGGLAAGGNPGQPANSDCKLLRGTEVHLYDPTTNIANGRITNSGYLDGTTVWSFPPQVTGGFVLTADSDVVSYLSDVTITTRDGQVRMRLLNTTDIYTAASTGWGDIDGGRSTGRFVGATGLIFLSSYVSPPDVYLGPYTSTITGQICFAK